MSGDTEMSGWPPAGDAKSDHATTQAQQAGPEQPFASSSAAFGLSGHSGPRQEGFAQSYWSGNDPAFSASAPVESWMTHGKGRKAGQALGYGFRGGVAALRKQSLLASEVTLPGNQEESQPNSHDEAEAADGDNDESMAVEPGAVPAPPFPHRPIPPFRSASASSSASSFRNVGPPFFTYSAPTHFEQRAPMERTNSSSANDDSPQARSSSSSPFSAAPAASANNSSASLWSTTAHLGRPGGPRRAASFSSRTHSNSGLSNSWAPSGGRGLQTPPHPGPAPPPPSRARGRSGSDSMSANSHSHSPSPLFQDSSPSSGKEHVGVGHLLRRPSSQPSLSATAIQTPWTQRTLGHQEEVNPPLSIDQSARSRQRTSSMTSMLARPAVGGGADFDIDIEDAKDSLDAFAMGGGMSRSNPANAAMTRTTSDSSGMISDVSNGNGPTAADQHERGRGRSTSNDAGGEARSNLPRMVRRKPINRSELLPHSKAHLRVAAQLTADETSPDLLTEADVHRRLRSGPAPLPLPPTSLPTPRLPSTPYLSSGGGLPASAGTDGRPGTSSGRGTGALPTPTRNRFPEQAGDEDEGMAKDDEDSSGSEQDHSGGIGIGIPIDMSGHGGAAPGEGALSVSWGAGGGFDGSDVEGTGSGRDEDDSAVSRRLKWTQFRGGSGPANGMFVGSPGSERGLPRPEMDHDMGGSNQASPSGGSALAMRPGKRKVAEFESYSTLSFKRRAISPSASVAGSSCVGSPILGLTLAGGNPNQPTPPPLHHISNITMPSPTVPQTHTFMSYLQNQHGAGGPGGSGQASRGSSPAPSSTFASGFGRPLGIPSAAQRETETEREGQKDQESSMRLE